MHVLCVYNAELSWNIVRHSNNAASCNLIKIRQQTRPSREFTLVSDSTVGENVSFVSRICKSSQQQLRQKVASSLPLFNKLKTSFLLEKTLLSWEHELNLERETIHGKLNERDHWNVSKALSRSLIQNEGRTFALKVKISLNTSLSRRGNLLNRKEELSAKSSEERRNW